MNYVLKTNALCKTCKNYPALNECSMNIPKGSIYGFIGKNGAGKTTLIRLICGLQKPTSGEYELYGKEKYRQRYFTVPQKDGRSCRAPFYLSGYDCQRQSENPIPRSWSAIL